MNLESKYFYVLGIAVLAFLLAGCEPKEPTDLSDHSLIPHPAEITATGGRFQLNPSVTVRMADLSLHRVADYLIDRMASLKVVESGAADIALSLDANDEQLGAEGYQLKITESQILISANHPQGVFYGVQTLLQMIPLRQYESVELPTGVIRDYPRYAYRGSMLDVSRHFFGVEDVKRYIDFITTYKMNVLHLHLSDDQGWRIEIKSKPELTAIGAATEVGGGDGGFYTQQQYKEIVKYAANRFITIIPEIDIPGHTQAALASYAALNCDGKAGDLYTGTKVGFSTLCTDNEATYEFVDAVIQELATITPGKYIHIGGDESHATKKEDYIYFINRVQKIVSKYGKTLIGWDEVAQANIETESIVQQWNSAGNATLAAEKGNRIILSPATLAYMDMKYDTTSRIGYDWAALIEVDQAYSWDPDTINAMVPVELIFGIEAPLWTETVENMEDIEYLVFPRLPGYAEIGWSAQSIRNWETYRIRLAGHAPRFESEGIDYYRSPLVDWGMMDSIN
ncbi:hexosaminidase [Reichenbachiella faecimaris]|uniref:beta-N-acetylhexosaminidase n=1 Tax=Reichenbachiella faecimaris TaxID=692418 RepID=A0A1W2G8Y1_REIFA|nr:beta-N-acetylhexosaminidase [Reichenbachiella faecimaris]SMD32902.1 hexosaminidase [Reichenbachiella faecimaris]